MDIVHLGRTRQHRHKILRPVFHHLTVPGVLVRVQPVHILHLHPGVRAGLLIRRKQRRLRARLDRHIGDRHARRYAHLLHRAARKLEYLVSRPVRPQISDQAQNHILRIHALRQLPVDDYLDRLRHPDPHLAGAQHSRHLRVADPRRKTAHAPVGRRVGVRPEHDIARFRVTHLRHQLMTDTVRPVKMGEPLLPHKSVPDLKMPHILHRAGRHQMVVDQHHLVGVPHLPKTHLTEFIHHKRDKDVVDHYTVHLHCLDIPRRHGRLPGISHHNLFNQCMSHAHTPFLACIAFTSPPAFKMSIRFSGRDAIGYSSPPAWIFSPIVTVMTSPSATWSLSS